MHLKSGEFSGQNHVEISQMVVFQWLELHKPGAPRVIEGAESISAIKIAILTLEISFSTTNRVAKFLPNLPENVQIV